MTALLRLEPLGNHGRGGFSSGEDALDRYFQIQATQDIRRWVASCFVAIDGTTGQIAGYYTIAAAGIAMVKLPPEETRRLPRYPSLPAVRIGRLAVDHRYRGRGLGSALLADAARRTLQAPLAAFTLLVEAKNEAAAAFYRHHGFRPLASLPRTLFLPLATAEKVLPAGGS